MKLESFDITDYVILAHISIKPMNVMQLVKAVKLAHKNLLNRLNKLEEMDIIDRIRASDTREVFVKLTPKGKALHLLYPNSVLSCECSNKELKIKLK